MTQKNQETDWLTSKQAATYTGFSDQTLRIWRCEGKGPKFTKVGKAIRYRRDWLDDFLMSGTDDSKEVSA